MNKNQKCIITISGTEEESAINMELKWVPDLDMKDDKNNHPGVVAAAVKAIDSIRSIEK